MSVNDDITSLIKLRQNNVTDVDIPRNFTA